MGYREMTWKEIWRTTRMLKDLRDNKNAKSYVARVATCVSKEEYSYFMRNPLMMKLVFYEELRKIEADRPENMKDRIKKWLYRRMIKNAIKLSQEVIRREKEKSVFKSY
ncbi:MAG: hypothetical protein QXY61_02265 [Candidatus Anstonellales archaeon]